ncbi:two-component hybrid sensor protein [Desulforapulum autotrophicum HRM2]|uniref:Two-component hybrid sensor protein n=1 Tax=Desulforapulum autotrophicum (strain ATCC 43914 / DSM 3382 / VKM B-1955 / HRM2) TaxID=177437 RepID=C0Q8Y8_DESAH|nr:response regulator [Desulforapulum autotrophicum]ACN14478.1 two-component hybrid sensor protein [Desulforapulum autotrophicum HRM2]
MTIIKKKGNPHPVDQKENTPDRIFDPKKIKILVAEDNLVNQKVFQMMLNRHGFSATIADNGTQLIQRLKQAPYDLILMDIQMPEMDGIQATRIIRNAESETRCKQVAIIAMTAHATHEDEQRCLNAGMDAYLAKPVTDKELIAMIRKVLENKEETTA